jgi:transcriptional regulator with AAA-type ATPase domain
VLDKEGEVMKDEARESQCADEMIHFSAYWNPTVEFDPTAPKGMKLWARVLDRFSKDPKQRYTLYGKVSVTPGKLGIDMEEIRTINDQVQAQNQNGQTHIYLFNTAHIEDHPYIAGSLHVGCVDAVLDEDSIKRFPRDHIPTEFYDSVMGKGYRVPIWFKITDLREIPLSEFYNLQACYPPSHKWEQFDQKNDLSPLKVQEKDPRTWFKTGPPRPHRAWYDLVLLSGVSGKREPLEPGLFRSPSIREVYTRALRYSGWGEPILILGERGTGKTVLASFIRYNYLRGINAKKREDIDPVWPQVSCGEFLNQELLKGELFGWKKGAHSTADSDYDGLFKQANGDCIFLDEVQNLPRQVQRLVIKAIEEKEFRPLKASSSEKSDFLLITASNRSIAELQESLDADFFDRITYAVLRLPPLRELGEDMLLLWRYEYEKAKEKMKGGQEPRASLSPAQERALVRVLRDHDLSGNFRDLTRVALHAVARLDDPKAAFSPEDVVHEALGWRYAGTEHSDQPELPYKFGQPLSVDKELISSAAANPKKRSEDLNDTNRLVLEAFLQRKSLVEEFPEGSKIDSMGLIKDFKRYLLGQCQELIKKRRFTWRDFGGESARKAFKTLKKS